MSTINIFQISFEIWGCIINIIICILMGTISFKTKDVIGEKLWRMILINNFLLVSDALSYIYGGDTTPLGITITRTSNFCLFGIEYVLLITFVRYVKCITSTDENEPTTWWEHLSYTLLAAAFIGLIITQFTGLYYFFDDTNHYQRGKSIWISFAVCGIVILICFFRLWLHRKKLSKTEKSTFSLCIMIFFVCIVVQFIFYGLSLINMSITISLLLMYLRHYTTQYDLYVNSSIEEAIRDTEALSAWKSVPDCIVDKTQEAQYEADKE